jgi:replicative DNA helicase
MTNLVIAAEAIAQAPMLIDDTPDLTIGEVRARYRRWRASRELFGDKPFGLVVVDDLQLMKGEATSRDANREQEISEIARGLKAWPRSSTAPSSRCRSSTVASSRATTSARCSPTFASPALSSRTPTSSRSSTATRSTTETQRIRPGVADVIIGKQRSGPIGHVELCFEGTLHAI